MLTLYYWLTRVNSYTCVDNSRKEIRQREHAYLNLDPMCQKKTVYDAGDKELGGTFYIENIPESCGTCSLC